MRQIIFSSDAYEEFGEWSELDRKIFKKLRALITETTRDPFKGTGKPEPLKGTNGYWSRRITSEHRLVYKVTPDTILVIACRFHYDD